MPSSVLCAYGRTPITTASPNHPSYILSLSWASTLFRFSTKNQNAPTNMETIFVIALRSMTPDIYTLAAGLGMCFQLSLNSAVRITPTSLSAVLVADAAPGQRWALPPNHQSDPTRPDKP